MNATFYQQLAKRTLIERPEQPLTDEETMKVWNALGVAGEAGELCDLVKKGIFHRHGIDVDKLKKEIGDVCWYLAGLATQFDLDFGEILESNIEKLKRRYPNGFSSDDSKKRVDFPGLLS
jgi:NTP pyrophosphatase (non-canonical NTP hydrolase)